MTFLCAILMMHRCIRPTLSEDPLLTRDMTLVGMKTACICIFSDSADYDAEVFIIMKHDSRILS